MIKAIAILLDDVLNNFSEALNNEGIIYDRKKHSITNPLLEKCLYNFKTGEMTKIAKRAMGCKCTCKGASPFLHSLLSGGWEIMLCTNRDLRFAYNITVDWLSRNDISYTYLVQTQNPVNFCKRMEIPYLISDRALPSQKGITVFNGSTEMIQDYSENKLDYFKEVMKCLQK